MILMALNRGPFTRASSRASPHVIGALLPLLEPPAGDTCERRCVLALQSTGTSVDAGTMPPRRGHSWSPFAPQLRELFCRLTPSGKQHDGLTMTELLVGMVLLVMVLAIAGRALMGMFDSAGRSNLSSGLRSQRRAAIEQFRSDVAKAVAPGRTGRVILSEEALLRMLRDGSVSERAYDPDTGNPLPGTPDVDDISLATLNDLIFKADVAEGWSVPAPQAGAPDIAEECVGYRLLDGQLMREVWPYSADCNRPADTAYLLRQALLPVKVDQGFGIFGYTGMAYRQGGLNAQPSPENCEETTTPSDAFTERLITTVHLNLAGFKERSGDGSAAEASSIVRVNITSREGREYQFALGCAR